MNSVKILHCADLHIGAYESFLEERSESRRFETLLTFENIVLKSRENDVKIILIAGDLFDSNTIEPVFFERVFSAMESVPDIEIVVAAGNHDPLNTLSPFITQKLPENLHILDTKDDCITFEHLNTRVYGHSFREVYRKGENEFSLIPPEDDKINLMCVHGEIRSDLGSNYNSITENFIKSSNMDYIALGHKHSKTEIGQKIGNTFCAYCGCAEGHGFDELGEKGVYLGTVSKGNCNLEFIPVCQRKYICNIINISECDTPANALQAILTELEKKHGDGFSENLYKIILTGEIGEDTDFSITELLQRLKHEVYYIKLCDKTTVKLDLNSLSNEVSLKGIFVKKMMAKIEAAADENKAVLQQALSLGLKAFGAEVTVDENQ